MELPTRIVETPPEESVITVDGLAGAPGLELSHWPGNRTPRDLKHDLSTGCALAFARLPEAERRRRAGDAAAIVNNHYDTDGVLALFAVRHPDRALPHAERMLAAASAGDFFRIPNEEALALDAIVTGFADRDRSPIKSELDGEASLPDTRRWETCIEHLYELLPRMLAGELDPYRDLWAPVIESARADRARLERAQRDARPDIDLVIWTATAEIEARRTDPGGTGVRFDPGRHALFGSTDADRVLALHRGVNGTSCRLIVSTRSWFDLVSERRLARPDLVALAARLNELESTAPDDPLAWRAQAATNASPELWFGTKELSSFAEHNDALSCSRLSPDNLRAEITRALGAR